MNLNPLTWLKKSSAMSLDQVADLFGFAGYSRAGSKTVNETTAMEVSAVFCAVRVIAEGVASMPLALKEDTYGSDDLKRTRVLRDHWAHKLLNDRPNPWMTSYEFVEWMTMQAALGKAALAVKNTVRDEVRELIPVPHGAWSVEQTSSSGLVYRVTFIDGTSEVFSERQVFVVRGPSLDGYSALPAVKAAGDAIALAMVTEQQQKSFVAGGINPSGFLTIEPGVKPEVREKLKNSFSTQFRAGGDGGIGLLDFGAKFEPMTMTSVDAQLLETRRFQIEEIARAFRVQPIMLMQADKAATYASAEQMFRMHVTHTLMPWVRRWEEALRRDILGLSNSLYFDFDERSLLRGDHKDQAEYYTKALGAGGQGAWMKPNEVRVDMGLNPVDEPWANELSRGAMEAREAATGATSPSQDE
ncbi:phage portal protein [Cribrihabitans marinus]|nr:phage portal protein [Cribrihabitans marinus]GGH24484.1 head portal protein [Cribrihabitans marinus]